MHHSLIDNAPSTRARSSTLAARLLTTRDLPQLEALEHDKWTDEQAASRAQMAERLETHPELCVGAFCVRSGQLMASLFMKPTSPDFWKHAKTWEDCVEAATPLRTSSLFGISLSSRSPAGVSAILEFFWPRALIDGWRDIYLGSPVPGWMSWRAGNPRRGITHYVRQRRAPGVPLDPQLRYYFSRGFREMICVKRNYFPHHRSQDHGVILRGVVPLSSLAPVWRALPPALTCGITRRLASAWL